MYLINLCLIFTLHTIYRGRFSSQVGEFLWSHTELRCLTVSSSGGGNSVEVLVWRWDQRGVSVNWSWINPDISLRGSHGNQVHMSLESTAACSVQLLANARDFFSSSRWLLAWVIIMRMASWKNHRRKNMTFKKIHFWDPSLYGWVKPSFIRFSIQLNTINAAH